MLVTESQIRKLIFEEIMREQRKDGSSLKTSDGSNQDSNDEDLYGPGEDVAGDPLEAEFNKRINKTLNTLGKRSKDFIKRVRRNAKKLVSDPVKFFSSPAGKRFEAILETAGSSLLKLGTKTGNPILAGSGSALLVAGLIVDIVQKDWYGLAANICLFMPGFMKAAEAGFYGEKVKNAKNVIALKQKIKETDWLRNIMKGQSYRLHKQNLQKVSDAIATPQEINNMNKQQLKDFKATTGIIHKLIDADSEASKVVLNVDAKVAAAIKEAEKEEKKDSNETIEETVRRISERIIRRSAIRSKKRNRYSRRRFWYGLYKR